MNFSKAIIALVLAVCLANAAHAKTQKVNARSGAKQQIWTQAVYIISGCYAAPFAKVSFRQPKNGKLTFVKRRLKVPAGRKCAGKTLNGIVVSYKSKSGFRGTDRGRAYFTFPAYRGEHVSKTQSVNFVINVK